MIDLNKFITLHVVQGSMELSLMQNQPVYIYIQVYCNLKLTQQLSEIRNYKKRTFIGN